MSYSYYLYDIPVVDQSKLDGFSPTGDVTSGVYAFVYDAGTKTLSTLYADSTGTSLSNPISRSQFATDGKVKFYGSATSYDIFLAHSDGSVAFYAGVTPQTHALRLGRTGVDRVLVFPIVSNAGGTETDTGLDLPYKAWVYDVAMEVTTAESAKNVDIGLLSSETAGDADGLLVQASAAATGLVKPFSITAGSNYYYISATKYGALFSLGHVGADTTNADPGIAKGWGHYVTGSNAVSVTYTPTASSSLVAYGFLYFKLMR